MARMPRLTHTKGAMLEEQWWESSGVRAVVGEQWWRSGSGGAVVEEHFVGLGVVLGPSLGGLEHLGFLRVSLASLWSR